MTTHDVMYGSRDLLDELLYHLSEAQKIASGTPVDVSEQIADVRKALDTVDEQIAALDEAEDRAMEREYYKAVI